MIASVLKQDPHPTKSSKERFFIMTQTHNMEIFGGNPLRQVTKRHLNNS